MNTNNVQQIYKDGSEFADTLCGVQTRDTAVECFVEVELIVCHEAVRRPQWMIFFVSRGVWQAENSCRSLAVFLCSRPSATVPTLNQGVTCKIREISSINYGNWRRLMAVKLKGERVTDADIHKHKQNMNWKKERLFSTQDVDSVRSQVRAPVHFLEKDTCTNWHFWHFL